MSERGFCARPQATPARLGVAQLGLAYFHYNRGDVERGRALAAEVLTLAEAQGSAELLVIGSPDRR